MSEPRVVIINDASVARGGATGLALLQAKLARSRGLDVTYFAGDRGGDGTLAELGISLRTAGGDPLMKAHPAAAFAKGLYNPAAARILADFVAETDTPHTIYHVHGFSKALSPSIFRVLSPIAPRVFLHAHDFFLACPNGGFMDYRAMRPCDRVPLSAGCIATNCDKRNYAQKLWRVSRQAVLHQTLPRRAPWAGIVLIHPAMAPFLEKAGYPAGLIRSVRNPATAFRAERVRAEDNRSFFFVGRVEAEKGIEEFLAVATAAGLPVTVVGDGPLRESLAALYPAVPFLGWMDRARIADVIGEARALVMPSRYPEPFGLVAAEASLSGVPVILPNTALLGPEVAGAGLGLTCDTRDPAAFSAALRQMADMPREAVEAMSRKGASGSAGLATTPDDWIDAQIALWNDALERFPT